MHNLLAQQIDLQQIQGNVTQNGGIIALNSNFTIGGFISGALPWVFTIAGMLLLIYLIFGGLQLMLSRGDPKNAQSAKTHITNALVGFIIIFIAYWVVQLVAAILGLQGKTIFH